MKFKKAGRHARSGRGVSSHCFKGGHSSAVVWKPQGKDPLCSSNSKQGDGSRMINLSRSEKLGVPKST